MRYGKSILILGAVEQMKSIRMFHLCYALSQKQLRDFVYVNPKREPVPLIKPSIFEKKEIKIDYQTFTIYVPEKFVPVRNEENKIVLTNKREYDNLNDNSKYEYYEPDYQYFTTESDFIELIKEHRNSIILFDDFNVYCDNKKFIKALKSMILLRRKHANDIFVQTHSLKLLPRDMRLGLFNKLYLFKHADSFEQCRAILGKMVSKEVFEYAHNLPKGTFIDITII